jgi:exopolysaccharide production protein ExoQ
VPTLALALSIVFSVWFLRRDSRRRPSISPAVWIPTLLVLALGSRSPSLWLAAISGDSSATAEGSPLDHVFYLTLAASAFIIANSRGVKWNRLFTLNLTVTLFYVFFAISVLWAENQGGSFKRLIKDFGFLGVVSLLLSEKEPMEALRVVYFRAACILLPLSVVCCRYYPNISRGYDVEGGLELSGVAIDKNHLGESVMVMALFLCWDYMETRSVGAKRSWKWDSLVLGILATWLMYTSNSKTAFTCMLIGFALMLVRHLRFASSALFSRTLLLVTLSFPVLVLLTTQFRATIGPVLAVLGRDATFTGRTLIWENINLKTVDPLIGAGFWNFWGGTRGLAIIKAINTPVPSAHNGYLDVYLDGGFIGLGILFILLFIGGNRLIKGHSSMHRFRFAVLIVAIVYNLTESLFARPSVLWFTTLVVLIDFPVRPIPRRFPRYSGWWSPQDVGSHEAGGHQFSLPGAPIEEDAFTEARNYESVVRETTSSQPGRLCWPMEASA